MKRMFFAFLLLCASFVASAKSFSLQVIQRNTGGDSVFDTSYVVEQAIMDYFFEHGMIVSSNHVIVSKHDDASETRELRRSLFEAKSGCMDLFVKLYLNFALEDSKNPSAVLLSNINNAELEILSTETTETVATGKYSPKVVPNQNDNRGGVESFATDIAADIHTRLSKKGGAK
ncbi:MAG: hypothetical protein K2I95_08635 [Treponemataceae bacterium]|nr:hypothetical protein [Treponemataceae bacterium]